MVQLYTYVIRAFMIAIFYHSFLTNAAISTWYIQTISDTGGEGVTVASSGDIYYIQSVWSPSLTYARSIVKYAASTGATSTIISPTTGWAPNDIALDSSGNLYIADSSYNRILKVDSSLTITTVAGTTYSPGYSGDGGQAISALLYFPTGIASDSSDNLYISDSENHCIRKIDTSSIITTIAGVGGISGYNGDNMAATSTQLDSPKGIAIDSSGNVYIADSGNGNIIRKVTVSTGIMTIIGGSYANANQGYASSGVAVDPSTGYVYLTDRTYSTVQRITQSTGDLELVAGIPGFAGYNDIYGPVLADSVALQSPYDIAIASSGNVTKLVVALNDCIALITSGTKADCSSEETCAAGSINKLVDGQCQCVQCPIGYYSEHNDANCSPCPSGRAAYLRDKVTAFAPREFYCQGLSSHPETSNDLEGDRCSCRGYWNGLTTAEASILTIVLMVIYEILLLSCLMMFVRNGHSRVLAMKLFMTISLSCLDTVSDLSYITSTIFTFAYFLALTIFFYIIQLPFFVSFLMKQLGPWFIFHVPAEMQQRNVYLNYVLLVPYRMLLLIVGFLLYNSKLLVLGPVYNAYMKALTNSNEYHTFHWVNSELLNSSLYEEVVFESMPQLCLQLMNLSVLTIGGNLWETYPIVLVSAITSGFTILSNVYSFIKIKYQGKKVIDIKTGFEGLLLHGNNATDSKKVFSVPEVEITEFTNEVVQQVAPGAEGPYKVFSVPEVEITEFTNEVVEQVAPVAEGP